MSKAKKTRNAHRQRSRPAPAPARRSGGSRTSGGSRSPGRPAWLRVVVAVLALAMVGALITLPFIGGDDSPTDTVPPPTTVITSSPFTYGTGECPPEDGVAEPVLDFDEPPMLCLDLSQSYEAVFDTSHGEVRVELDTERTPGTANNFATLARYGYYDGSQLFRTDPSIDIIQGGSPHTQDPSDPGPGYRLQDEGGDFVASDLTGFTGPFRYEPGQLVMARSAGPDGAGAQFFFTTGPLVAQLDSQGTFVVFGTTDQDGLDVLLEIMALHVDDPESPLGGGPSETVTVNEIRIESIA